MPDLRAGSTDWSNKPVETWLQIDVMHWLMSVAKSKDFPYEELKMPKFNVVGSALLALAESDFVRRDAVYGSSVYASLQAVRETEGKLSHAREREAEGRLQGNAQAVKIERDSAIETPDVPKKRRGRPPGSCSGKVGKKESK